MRKQWLYDIMKNNTGIKISRVLFSDFVNGKEITQEVFPKKWKQMKKNTKKHYSDPYVSRYKNNFESYGFIESKSFPQEVWVKGRKQTKHFKKNRMNLNPIFNYANIEKNVIFTPEEKKELGLFFSDPRLRKLILDQFPRDTIIDSFLKFYTIYFIQDYAFKIRSIFENPEEEKRLMKKIKENRKHLKKLSKTNKGLVSLIFNAMVNAQQSHKITPSDKIGAKILEKDNLHIISWFHIYKMGKPELWESIEIKILKTLGISN